MTGSGTHMAGNGSHVADSGAHTTGNGVHMAGSGAYVADSGNPPQGRLPINVISSLPPGDPFSLSIIPQSKGDVEVDIE